MTPADEDQPHEQGAMAATALARSLGVPPTVMSFLESQFPEIRAIRTGEGRAYRANDAALIAGIVMLLYDEGRPFRDVEAAVRSGERKALADRGAARLGLPKASTQPAAPEEAVPADAIVRRRGPMPAAPEPVRPTATSSVISELMTCIGILAAARRD